MELVRPIRSVKAEFVFKVSEAGFVSIINDWCDAVRFCTCCVYDSLNPDDSDRDGAWHVHEEHMHTVFIEKQARCVVCSRCDNFKSYAVCVP
jgi:hypothetical protein